MTPNLQLVASAFDGVSNFLRIEYSFLDRFFAEEFRSNPAARCCDWFFGSGFRFSVSEQSAPAFAWLPGLTSGSGNSG
jgi:hypothetical protein